MFASPLYMMQVYDRVLSGRSLPTLVGLTIILVSVLIYRAHPARRSDSRCVGAEAFDGG